MHNSATPSTGGYEMHVLTTAETAALLRVCPATVRRMVHRGELDGIIRRSLTRITVDSIERLLGAPLSLAGESDEITADDRGALAAAPYTK